MHKNKEIFLFPWCTGTQNTLGQSTLTFGIHLITMVGQDIHGEAAIHGPREPFLALVWTHFESYVRKAIVSDFAHFLNMHVFACLLDKFVFITMDSEPVPRHYI